MHDLTDLRPKHVGHSDFVAFAIKPILFLVERSTVFERGHRTLEHIRSLDGYRRERRQPREFKVIISN